VVAMDESPETCPIESCSKLIEGSRPYTKYR
jgi:hypothetical protein